MPPFRLHPEADAEAIGAAKWIKADDPREGDLFVQALETAIFNARKQPEIYRPFDGEFKKIRLGKFHYALVFRLRDGEIQILAVMHLHRRPGYWKERSVDF